MFISILIIFFALISFSEEVTLLSSVTTNKYIVSNTVDKNRWERFVIMADKDNKPIDPSNQLVPYADSIALDYLTDNIGQIADSARGAVDSSMESLYAVTNQLNGNSIHIAISLQVQNLDNLSGMVVDEGSDGTNDWQFVKYSQLLTTPPLRHVEYVSSVSRISVKCEWDFPWDTTNYIHRCKIKRPDVLVNAPMRFLSKRSDVLGGSKGFSFGGSVVKVDNLTAFTGVVSNSVDGSVLTFKQGVLIDSKGGNQ